MPDDRRPRIIDVTRKPSKCPDCGSEVVDIVYGTGDMTESDFLFEYRKSPLWVETTFLVVRLYGVVRADANALGR